MEINLLPLDQNKSIDIDTTCNFTNFEGTDIQKMTEVKVTGTITKDVADDYFKEKEKNNDLQKQADDLKEQLESCKKELEEAKKEIEQLNRDIYILKDDMNMLAEEKAQVEDQLDEYFVALDASKNITSKNKNRQ